MSGKQVPDRMLAHAARAKGACDDFSVCRAFWSFWAPKGHDITTTKRIYDCRLRVSCIKEYKRLFNVLSVLKRYSPYSLQVNRLEPSNSIPHIKQAGQHTMVLSCLFYAETITSQLSRNSSSCPSVQGYTCR